MINESPQTERSQLGWYALALGLALLVRLARLGNLPLTEMEAQWASQAVDLAKGLHPAIGAQPLYVLFTAVVFFVFQANEFTARVIPALFGTALVFAPYFFRDRLGRKAALTLAFLLAFEPGLLAMSRMAGSPVLAVSTLALAWGLWRAGKIRAAGALAGLALLGGPQLWPGLLGLAITYGLAHRFLPGFAAFTLERSTALRALAFAVGAYLAFGSLFLLAPGGLGAGLSTFTAYFSGWLDFTDVPASRLMMALLVYQLPALLLAATALARGWMQGDERVSFLGLWLLASLVLALFNPFRQVTDLAWALLPLWALAALEIARFLSPAEDGGWETFAMMAFTLAILAFTLLNFINIAVAPYAPDATETVLLWQVPLMGVRWAVLLSSLLLLTVSIFMVAYGWSVNVAVQGSVWGLLAALAVYNLSAGMAAGGLRTSRTQELWSPGLYIQQSAELNRRLTDISHWQLTPAQPLDITVAAVDSPALHWALRNANATFVDNLTITGAPAILIAPDQFSSADLQAGYRGANLYWRIDPGWNSLAPHDWLKWGVTHQVTQPGQEKLIFWVRSDLFVDSPSRTP